MKKPELLVIGIDGGLPQYVKNAVAEGKLPAFAKLMKKGVLFNDCMTAFPSITPTCWTAIETGAPPMVSGAYCQSIHVPGTHPSEFITSYNAVNIHAERFWEAAARIGKRSLMVDVPSSGPAKSNLVMQIMGGTSISPDRDPADTVRTGVPMQTFRINFNDEHFNDGVKTRAGVWERFKNGDTVYEKRGDNVYVFEAEFREGTYIPGAVEPHSWTLIVEDDGIRLGEDEKAARNSKIIKPNTWSDIIVRRLKTDNHTTETKFVFRAKVDLFDRENNSYVLSITACVDYKKEITPLYLAKEIEEIEQLYTDIAATLWHTPCKPSFYLDLEEWSLDWHKKVIEHCLGKYGADIVFDYIGFVDSVNHRFASTYQKVKEDWESEWDIAAATYERSYQLVDEHIAWLLENVTDESTTVMVISDHGAIGYSETKKIYHVLEDAGLITYIDPNGNKSWRNINIDWSKTRAYPVGSCHINVNLKGRDPTGIVDPKDYDQTVNEIIRAIQNNIETADGATRATAFCVEKSQAGFIGHGGENCGDVVYGIIGSRLGGSFGGVHSVQIPSARSTEGDIRSLCMMCGPAFKENLQLDRPIDLYDFAPTLCYAMGYPQPRDSTGGVIFQALKANI